MYELHLGGLAKKGENGRQKVSAKRTDKTCQEET